MSMLFSLIAGILFGIGMIVSGMANPAKVLNFLDLTGNWDPSLAFVMAGAIAVAMPGFRMVSTRTKPLYATEFQLPTRKHLDGRLIGGSVIFGIGWGLVGYCPGPALTGLSMLGAPTVLFVAAMLIGMIFAKRSVRAS